VSISPITDRARSSQPNTKTQHSVFVKLHIGITLVGRHSNLQHSTGDPCRTESRRMTTRMLAWLVVRTMRACPGPRLASGSAVPLPHRPPARHSCSAVPHPRRGRPSALSGALRPRSAPRSNRGGAGGGALGGGGRAASVTLARRNVAQRMVMSEFGLLFQHFSMWACRRFDMVKSCWRRAYPRDYSLNV